MQSNTPSGMEAPTAPPAGPDEPPRVLLHMPVDVRNASTALIAILLGIYALHWAAAVAVPLLLSLLFGCALSPVVDRLERARIPRSIGAAAIVLGVVGGLGWTTYVLADDAAQLIESLPSAAQKLRSSLRARISTAPGALDKVQKAAAELEKAADENAAARVPLPKGVTPVQMVHSKFNIHDHLWTGTMGLITVAGQTAVVFMLTYFLLASGNTFRRKMVRIAGPTLSQKKITVQALDEITEQIKRYLLTQMLISVLVGVTTWLAFLGIGLQNAVVWGVAAAVLNLVPYIGSLVMAAAAMLVALMQFGTLDMALVVAGICFAIRLVSGYVLSPWWTSRTCRLSPVAVFVAVLVWGWLWGVWGMLLGVPIILVVKATCDRAEGFKPLGELLGP